MLLLFCKCRQISGRDRVCARADRSFSVLCCVVLQHTKELRCILFTCCCCCRDDTWDDVRAAALLIRWARAPLYLLSALARIYQAARRFCNKRRQKSQLVDKKARARRGWMRVGLISLQVTLWKSEIVCVRVEDDKWRNLSLHAPLSSNTVYI